MNQAKVYIHAKELGTYSVPILPEDSIKVGDSSFLDDAIRLAMKNGARWRLRFGGVDKKATIPPGIVAGIRVARAIRKIKG